MLEIPPPPSPSASGATESAAPGSSAPASASPAPAPCNSEQRLAALRRYAILDTPAEGAFDDITRLVAHICQAPIAVINFIDEGRQWFKSEIGLGVRETPLDVSICAHAILQRDLFIVPDTTKDERFKDNPLVAGRPHLRFYAGALLQSPEGQPLGTLCVLDYVPRELADAQKDALRALARQVMTQMELRRALAAQGQMLEERARAEEALRMSEARFRRAVEQSPLSTQICAPDGAVRRVNAAWERLFGVTIEAIPGYNVLHDPQLLELGVMPQIARAFQGEASVVPPVAYVPDRGVYRGQKRWCGTFAYPVKDDAGRVEEVILVHEDITERKDAEQALTESQRRLQTLFDTTQDAILLADDAGRYVDANPAACELTGYTHTELMRLRPSDLTPAPTQDAGEELWRAFRESGRQSGEYALVRKDGSRGVVEYRAVANILPGLHLSVLRDVTERRRAEEALRDSEERHRLVARATQDVIWDWNRQTDELLWNEAVETVFGYPRVEIQPTSGWWKDRVHPQDRDRVVASLERAIHGGGNLWSVEYRFLRSDGTYAAVFDRGHIARDDAGDTVRMIGSMLDLSERKRAEEELKAAKESAEAAKASAEAANAAKDQFLAVLSHELRTPLTPVLMAVSAMAADPDLPQHAREEIAMVRRNVELEARLIDDLLDLTRVSRGKLELHFQTLDAHALLRQSLDITRAEAATRWVAVTLDLSATNHHVRADPTRLQQVFWNVLKNAVKFTPPQGNVSVRTLDGPGGSWRVEVVDTGVGIEPHALPLIFDAFEQGDPSMRQFGGLGLGLAISKKLMDLHGGTVTAASEGKGRGATFAVELPAVPAPGTSGAPTASAPEPPAGRRLRLLLVEDHEHTAVLMARLLRRLGHHVTAADSVRAALQAAASESFDLVISDLGLPDASGLDLMRELKSRHGLTGIALSGYGMEEDVSRSREAGFAAHLTKPIDFQRLKAIIDRAAPATTPEDSR